MHDGNFLPALAGLRSAVVEDAGPDGRLKVSLPGEPPLWAPSLAPAGPGDIGRTCVVAPLDGDGLVVVGFVKAGEAEITRDGERMVIEARREVVLRCGKASLTLTADGRVTIRGTELLSRARGANRVQGASVQLN